MHHHGQLWNASTIAGSLGVTPPSVRHYLDILESTFMVRVLHALLNLPSHDALQGHPMLGASWEGWVIEQILAEAPIGSRASFYRTASGSELDLLLELPGGHLRAIEIKHTAAPKLGKGFVEALDTLELESGFVVAQVREPYAASKRARALPLSHLAEIWRD